VIDLRMPIVEDARRKYEVAIVYGDMHIPYENVECRNILLKLIDIIQPDMLISGGDDIDGESLSKFEKYPEQISTLQYELDEFYSYSDYLCRNFPTMRKIFLHDNHFYKRLESQKKIAHWLYTMRMFSLESLIKADEYNWEVNNEFNWKNVLLITHGDDEKGNPLLPSNCARNNFKQYGYSIIRFHSHGTGIELHNHLNKTSLVAQLGTFQDKNKAKYIKSKQRVNWTTSAGVLYLSREDDSFFFEPLLFFDDAIICRGSYIHF